MLDLHKANAETISHALPERFPFYHLGEVSPASDAVSSSGDLPPAEALAEAEIVGFRISGELQGLALILFERGLDLSTYTEMGNLLAGRFVTRLSSEQGIDAMISAPFIPSEAQLSRVRETVRMARKPVLRRPYLHVHPDGRSSPVQFLLIPLEEGAGNA